MSRLINDDELKKSIHEKTLFSKWQNVLIETVIDDQPTVDAVPVVHSYWRTVHMSEQTGYDPTLASYVDPVYGHVCAVCRADAIVNDTGDEVLTIYCPHCGARMDGEV